MKFWLLPIVCIGCWGPPPDPDCERGADELRARNFVWHDTFHVDYWPPPTVLWGYNKCASDPTGPNEITLPNGDCVAGVFWIYPYDASVAWLGSYSRSAYAHELMHAWQWVRAGIDDTNHELFEWNEIPQINAKLAEMGL